MIRSRSFVALFLLFLLTPLSGAAQEASLAGTNLSGLSLRGIGPAKMAAMADRVAL